MKLNLLPCKIRYGSDYAKNRPNNASQLSKTYEKQIDKLRKKFPRLSAVYSLVYGGMRGIINDFKEYFGITIKLSKSNSDLQVLSLEELEFYQNFELSFRKLIPISLLGVLPFGNALIIPLVYFIPRKTVTHHFWTENQKATFPYEDYKERLQYHKPVIEYLKECPSGRIADGLLNDWRKLVEKLDNGARPEVSDVLKVSPLFHRNGPFYLQSLPKLHVIHLIATYGLTSILSPLRKGVRFAEFNVVVDKKIVQRGGPKVLKSELRSQICFLRGVDSMNMNKEEQIDYLQKWLNVNAKIDISNYSLLLHTPVLLGYNAAHSKFDVSKKR